MNSRSLRKLKVVALLFAITVLCFYVSHTSKSTDAYQDEIEPLARPPVPIGETEAELSLCPYDTHGGHPLTIPIHDYMGPKYYVQQAKAAEYLRKNPPACIAALKNFFKFQTPSYQYLNETAHVTGNPKPKAVPPVDVGKRPWLFIDDYLIDVSFNLERVLTQPKVIPNNNISSGANPYISVMYDGSEVTLSHRVNITSVQLLKSRDGLNFTKFHGVLDYNPGQFHTSMCLFHDPFDPDSSRRTKVGHQFYKGTYGCPRIAFMDNPTDWTFPMGARPCCSGYLKEECGILSDCLNCVYYSVPLKKYVQVNRKAYATHGCAHDIRGVRFSTIDATAFYNTSDVPVNEDQCDVEFPNLHSKPCVAYNNWKNWETSNAFAYRGRYGIKSHFVSHTYAWGVSPFPDVYNPTVYIGFAIILKYPRVVQKFNVSELYRPETLHLFLSSSPDGVNWDMDWIDADVEFAPSWCDHKLTANSPCKPESYFPSDKFITINNRHLMYFYNYYDSKHGTGPFGPSVSLGVSEIEYGRFVGMTPRLRRKHKETDTWLWTRDILACKQMKSKLYDHFDPTYGMMETYTLIVPSDKLTINIARHGSDAVADVYMLDDTGLQLMMNGVVKKEGIAAVVTWTHIDRRVTFPMNLKMVIVLRKATVYGFQFK